MNLSKLNHYIEMVEVVSVPVSCIACRKEFKQERTNGKSRQDFYLQKRNPFRYIIWVGSSAAERTYCPAYLEFQKIYTPGWNAPRQEASRLPYSDIVLCYQTTLWKRFQVCPLSFLCLRWFSLFVGCFLLVLACQISHIFPPGLPTSHSSCLSISLFNQDTVCIY